MAERGVVPRNPPAPAESHEPDLPAEFAGLLASHGVSRRRSLQYCAGLTATLALPSRMSAQLAHGLAQAATAAGPHRVIWLEFQDCAGCTESFLRGQDPDVATLVLGMISLDYQETLMAAAGHQAEQARQAVIAEPGYLLIVEGSIPHGDMPGAGTIGGRSASDLLAESAHNAAAIVAVGTCASFGGIPAANPNPTGTVPAQNLISGVPLINVSGCPPNGDNIAATIAHWVSFGGLPAIASYYLPWSSIGAGAGNYLSVGEFSSTGQPPRGGSLGSRPDLLFPPGIVLGRDLTTVHPLDPAQITEEVARSWYSYTSGDDKPLRPFDGQTTPNYTGPRPPSGRGLR